MNKHSEISASTEPEPVRGRRFADWPLALKSILAFWFVYTLTVAARALLSPDPWTMINNRWWMIASGIAFTAVVYLAIQLFAGRAGLKRKAIVAGIASMSVAIADAWLIFSLEHMMKHSKEEFRIRAQEGYVIVEKGNVIRIERTAQDPLVLTLPRMNELDTNKQVRWIADSAVTWFFFYAAWSAFYLAMLAQANALGLRRRAVEAESAARAAQVRALRYQVNPHFLFNTLNSLSSLVMSSRPNEAEEMILKLSTFFRSSLSLDPAADVTLAEEIALQRLYLDIEKVRFPKRLKVEVDVPSDLENARVPGLILQPVVENAIKYGVSGARESVLLKIAAREAGPGRFAIEITNSASTPRSKKHGQPASGTGVGLTNVCQRLAARFGDAAQCEFGASPDGGYRVVLTLPLDRGNG